AALHHHRPDADETVRLRAGPDAQHLPGVDGGQDVVGEAAVGGHESASSSTSRSSSPSSSSTWSTPGGPLRFRWTRKRSTSIAWAALVAVATELLESPGRVPATCGQ